MEMEVFLRYFSAMIYGYSSVDFRVILKSSKIDSWNQLMTKLHMCQSPLIRTYLETNTKTNVSDSKVVNFRIKQSNQDSLLSSNRQIRITVVNVNNV